MARISKAHPLRVALVFCAMAATAALSPAPASANADLLGGLTGQVEEVVSPVVQASPPVQQVAETVTSTAQGVTTKITPSAAKAADAASSPPADRAGGIPEPADALTEKATKQASDAASAAGVPSAAGAATQAAEGAVHAATEESEAATGSTLPDSPVSSTALDPAAARAAVPTDSAAPTDPPPAPRITFVPSPRNDGSTGAPLPRWIAYVWPAVALTGPTLANFGESWGQAIVRLATGASAGSGAEGGVAGVHASGGRPEAAGSSPLFSSIPSDVGHAFSSVPTPVFIYLGLLVLAVIAVALAVRREIGVGRHQ